MSQIQALLDFLAQSPTPFHAVQHCRRQLVAAGYAPLAETAAWQLDRGGKYLVTRNDSSLVAFDLRQPPAETGFRLVGAHTDSPVLRVKPNAISTQHGYVQLAVEVYGSALLHTWFDRDLSLAGRVNTGTAAGAFQTWLLDFEKPIAFLPSLAIHLNRDVNEKHSINQQKHLPLLLSMQATAQPAVDFAALLKAQIERQYGAQDIEHIFSFELSLYACQPPQVVGLHGEFIAAARLDNLLSCYAGLQALLNQGDNGQANCVLVLNDHEEVGSASTSGAAGPLLLSVLERICRDRESLRRALGRSMLISADNAHAVHPNFPDKHEPNHQPRLNAGPVIKLNHNQRYATNSETEAVYKRVCVEHQLPYQSMVVRSDMACGSTIGPITATRLGLRSIDIGVPQLGMHSIRELAGVADQQTLVAALRGFYALEPWPF